MSEGKQLENTETDTSVCTKCGRRLLRYKFFKDATKKSGHHPRCKDCYRRRLGQEKRAPREVNRQGVVFRRCSTCKEYKYRSEFYNNPASHDGTHYHCKPCSIKHSQTDAARATTKKRNQRERREVMEGYGGTNPKCVCCHENLFEFLTIDHINNDGAYHRRNLKTSLYRWLKRNNFPDGFQILCMNCNFAKGKYGKCPHNYEKNESKGA